MNNLSKESQDEFEDRLDSAACEYRRLIELGHSPKEAAAICDTAFGFAPQLLDALDDLFDTVAAEFGYNTCNWPGFMMDAGDKALAAIALAATKEEA